MPVLVVVGTQWGDEGKGKIIDILSQEADIVARFQGGHNAGHTVVIGDKKFVLHLVPSGILHEGKKCIIGSGVVVDPFFLVSEMEGLKNEGIDITHNLFISKKSHIILPYHLIFDKGNENNRGENKIGTTGRGIGPAYSDKMSRTGIRMGDLLDTSILKEKLAVCVANNNNILKKMYNKEYFSYEQIFDKIMSVRDKLSHHIVDTTALLHKSISRGEKVLCEGAQGTMLDIDHGTYPFVTSSNATSGGACTGLGIPPNKINKILGVSKAYTTRVGDGPFPTELNNLQGEMLRKEGHEFGATTGRPRRCGWFDAVIANYSSRLNGLNSIALTKLDVLDKCSKLYICTAYKYKNDTFTHLPSEAAVLKECTPIYKEVDGWQEDTTKVRDFSKLPDKTKYYIDQISQVTHTEISIISTGQKRDEIAFRDDTASLFL